MADYILKNSELTVTVSSAGAEIRSVKDNATGQEYMWQADLAFWGWTSPNLFPIVGNVMHDEFRYKGKAYSMKQHGFGRRSEFAPADVEGCELGFALEESESTLAAYPFRFRFEVGYNLAGRSLKITWRVINPSDETIYFQVGAHPAFNTPPTDSDAPKNACYLAFDTDKALDISLMNLKDGGLSDDKKEYPLEEGGFLRITDDLFDINTLIIENEQVHKISLCDADKKPYVTVRFEAPLVAVWSPKAAAPFVCLEPWYGRLDRTTFAGELPEREYEQKLEPAGVFEKSYDIDFE